MPLLAYGPGSGLGRVVAAAAPEIRRAPAFTSHLAAALRSLVRDGRGIAWLPESLVAGDLAAGTLVTVGAEPLPLEIVVIRPAGPLARAAEALWSQVTKAAPAP
jgi:DNA-binding transcriptional LysR family regulator